MLKNMANYNCLIYGYFANMIRVLYNLESRFNKIDK